MSQVNELQHDITLQVETPPHLGGYSLVRRAGAQSRQQRRRVAAGHQARERGRHLYESRCQKS